MSHCLRVALCALLLLFPVSTIPQAPPTDLALSSVEDFQAAFTAIPCKNEERLAAVKALFREMGATEADYTVEKIKDVENFVLRKVGETDEKIIIGAHYDMTGPGSCGAVDNWTGIVAIAHLYRTLKDAKLKKTLIFVGFGQEEKGLIGSRAMAKQIKKDELNQYCAMINLDSLGMTVPMVMTNVSQKKLTELTKEIAKKMDVPLKTTSIANADTDSTPFLDKKIPSISLVAMTPNWAEVFHHKGDQANIIKPESVYLGYRLALSLVARVNEEECGAYR
ncbi:MAG: M20/M25/M40 family metallo-hydrolase [Blastocatellia bacterium]